MVADAHFCSLQRAQSWDNLRDGFRLKRRLGRRLRSAWRVPASISLNPFESRDSRGAPKDFHTTVLLRDRSDVRFLPAVTTAPTRMSKSSRRLRWFVNIHAYRQLAVDSGW
jgi:hypothetical protein